MSGSVYRGDDLNNAVANQDGWNWVGHIDCNALYNLQDKDFIEFLRLVDQYEPTTNSPTKFDISMWRVLHAFPYTWPLYQKFRGKFVHADFIHDWSLHMSENDMEFSSSRPNVYLVRGSNSSNSNLLERFSSDGSQAFSDLVSKSTRLSLMVRSFRGDMLFAREAVQSAAKYVPGALEIVMVVPQADLHVFRSEFSNLTLQMPLRFVGERYILEDQHVQQKWSKIHADTYCRGDMILHLDSDVVFRRFLRMRDIMWLGRPILVYQRYDTLNSHRVSPLNWGKGISKALGSPVEHEFSRSTLHIYPRSLYPHARRHIEKVHGVNITTFLQGKEGVHSPDADASRLFSDFNYLGAYAWKFAQEDFSFIPMDLFERRELKQRLPPPLIPLPLCQGNARLSQVEDWPDLLPLMLSALHAVWEGGLGCERIPDLEAIAQKRTEELKASGNFIPPSPKQTQPST
jgi:hypothetical protein